MSDEKNLKGIGIFALTVLHLISLGKKETFTTVEKHFEDNDIVEYLQKNMKMSFLQSLIIVLMIMNKLIYTFITIQG